jgi:aryl carrier-like protein
LGVAQVGVDDNFFAIGGDSILSLQIVGRAKQQGIHLVTKDLFQHQTIRELAAGARVGTQNQAEQGVVTGELPLTPIQQWFLAQDWRESHHFNQALLLTGAPSSTPSDWRAAYSSHLGIGLCTADARPFSDTCPRRTFETPAPG